MSNNDNKYRIKKYSMSKHTTHELEKLIEYEDEFQGYVPIGLNIMHNASLWNGDDLVVLFCRKENDC